MAGKINFSRTKYSAAVKSGKYKGK